MPEVEFVQAHEEAGSTRHVALARLPPRIRRPSLLLPKAVSDYREFQDGELVPGTRYRVARLIGTGGMGRVYEVEHVELGKRFVLKALLRELSQREDLVARLRNEWRALARLEHPNIVNVTDAGTSDNGVPFYVMERLEGETLSELLHRRRRLHPQHALGISASILEGLHAAHQIGVVHRDVKPPNVFLTARAVKVLDFGIAKIKDAKGVVTARGLAVGTPRYMSPEQAQGAPVDARSDIYATGLMLFEMLSGVGPFDDAQDHNELLLAHLGRKAPLLSSICVVAPELDAMVAGMLAKDPRERPASARQVAETLRQLAVRYAHFVATDAPTVNATPRPISLLEPATRVEGGRRAVPAVVTRPDGPLALGRAPEGDPTTRQPTLEVATTAAHALPSSATSPGQTQRLVAATPAPSAPLTFYGPDTLVDPLTQAPTAVPESAPVRTEILLEAVSPGQEAAPTQTAVPLIEGPNLTPPPVVPSGSLPALQRPSRPTWLVVGSAATLIAALLLLGGGWLWSERAAPPLPAAAAAAAERMAPASPALPAISAPSEAPVPELLPTASAPVALPAATGTDSPKPPGLGPKARPESSGARRSDAAIRANTPSGAAMPGSGL